MEQVCTKKNPQLQIPGTAVHSAVLTAKTANVIQSLSKGQAKLRGVTEKDFQEVDIRPVGSHHQGSTWCVGDCVAVEIPRAGGYGTACHPFLCLGWQKAQSYSPSAMLHLQPLLSHPSPNLSFTGIKASGCKARCAEGKIWTRNKGKLSCSYMES